MDRFLEEIVVKKNRTVNEILFVLSMVVMILTAVSYTHLDVYKRQSLCSRWKTASPPNFPKRKRRKSMKSLNDLLREMTTWGTPACGAFCGVIGIVVAVLLLTIGFWETVLVALMCALGVFLGAVKDKSAFCKRVINKLFPPKA